jgi:hypothetical protein
MMKIRWLALPVLALPLYSTSTALEACSSEAPIAVATRTSDLTCSPGEIEKDFNHQGVCCTQAADGTFSCRNAGASREEAPGAACTTIGASKESTSYTATFDVCVEEQCTGDRRCTEFPLRVEKSTGTLRCAQTPSGAKWTLDPTSVATHRVDRACLVSQTDVCYGAGYSSVNPDVYGYTSSYWDGYSQVCGYAGSYGTGPSTINVRRLYTLDSTCTSGGASAPCGVGDL